MKTCIKCGIEKDELLFVKGTNQCKSCKSVYDKKYQQDNAEQIRENNKKYYTQNKEKALEYQNIYYIENRESYLEYKRQWYQENKEQKKSYSCKYREENKDTILNSNNEYKKNKRKNDPSFKLRNNISRQIIKIIRLNGGSKDGKSIFDYLPYSFQELKEHIESQFELWMNWDNLGVYNKKIWNDDDISTWKWQIDHIVPQADLLYSSMEDENFQKCWALENLRPLSAKQNLLDGVNRVRHQK